jgi:hypothetical protein
MFLLRYPPTICHSLTWRALYRAGAFAQRELIDSGSFKSRVRERAILLGTGDEPLAYLHQVGALRSVAFSHAPYWSGMQIPAEPGEQMSFSDEQPSTAWENHAYELHGRPHVSALYSHWQLLLAGDAVDGGRFTVPLSALADEQRRTGPAVEQLGEMARAQQDRWMQLDDAWRPLLLALVRLQNRYLPDLTLRTTLLFDPETGGRVDPYPGEVDVFEPGRVFQEDFCEDRDGLLAAYEFLIERGLRHDPEDGLTMLRRARPRAFHIRWRGEPRRAQDHFDAADILRRILTDLDGHQPAQPSMIPLDGRQLERAELYRRGPGSPWTATDVVSALQDAELYPHGVHVVHEGRTDRPVVETLLASMLWPGILEDVGFTDLGGAGNAGVLADLVGSLDGYTRRVVVISDSEAKARPHVEAVIGSGGLPAADALLFATSLEEENATDDELAGIAAALGADAGEPLKFTGEELRHFHEERVARARRQRREIPGLAKSLQALVSRTTSGRWHLRKPVLDERLADLLVAEMSVLARDDWWRPLPVFVAERIVPPLNRPRPVGMS